MSSKQSDSTIHNSLDSEDAFGDGDIAAAIRAGKAASKASVLTIEGIPHAVVPEGVILQNLEELLPAPCRIRGNRNFEEPQSFIDYVKDFLSKHTRLHGIMDDYSFLAILNDSIQGAPQWGDHKAGLQLKLSPEWKEWMEACSEPLTQGDLAQFLEEHLEQIAQPDAGEILSDIRAIHITNSTRCESVQREGGDIAFSYATETAAGTKTERGKIPSKLTLMIAPFRSWHPVQMTVSLNYRINQEKQLRFTMQPHQSEQLVNASFNDVRQHISRELDLPVLM